MPSVSNIAVGALVAGSAASKARHGMNESIARLSTGMRSMYGGDAAGQSVANTLEARSKSWAVAARNAEDGISAAQTAESALLEIAALAQRLREVAIQADNAAVQSTSDIAALDAEAKEITKAMALIVEKTKFNGKTLISTADLELRFGATDDGSVVILNSQLIADNSDTTAAAGAETQADAILDDVGEALGNTAAAMTVLKARQNVAYAASANMMAAAARLEDTDFATSSANLAKFSILKIGRAHV